MKPKIKRLSLIESRQIMRMRIPMRQNKIARLLKVSPAMFSLWLANRRKSARIEREFYTLYIMYDGAKSNGPQRAKTGNKS